MNVDYSLFYVTFQSFLNVNIAPILHKAQLKSLDKKMNDLNYWLAQPLVKRLEAVTFLISQTVDLKTTRMDKTHVVRRKLKA